MKRNRVTLPIPKGPRRGWQYVTGDPPWSFSDKGSRIAPDQRSKRRRRRGYKTLELDEVKALGAQLAPELADDALLFLWATSAHLVDGSARKVARAWGFVPKATMVWVKTAVKQPEGPRDMRPVPGFDGYLADEAGGIWSTRARGHQDARTEIHRRRTELTDNGYLRVHVSLDGKKSRPYVHRLVLLAFQGPPPEGHEAAHLDGDRQNNAAGNLAWKTHVENEADKVLHGTRGPRIQIGAGHYVRHAHELVLVCSRGRGARLIKDRGVPSVFFAPRGAHSAKPDAFRRLVDRLAGGAQVLELFARSSWPKWTGWGDEAPPTAHLGNALAAAVPELVEAFGRNRHHVPSTGLSTRLSTRKVTDSSGA